MASACSGDYIDLIKIGKPKNKPLVPQVENTYANYLDVCGDVNEKCKLGCGIVLPHIELNVHMGSTCVKRRIILSSCEHCKKICNACEMSNHLEECPKIPLTCELGCGTVVCREDMARHLDKDCSLVREKCKLGCEIVLPRAEHKIHVNGKCVQRKIPCKLCQRDTKVCDMSNHQEECPKIQQTCELGCGTVVCREDMARHLEEECVEKKVECPFIKYKCEVGLVKRKELNQHLEEKRTEHTELKLSAMEEIVMKQGNEINKQNGKISAQSDLIEYMSQRFTTLCSVTKTTNLEWRIENVQDIVLWKQIELAGFKFDLSFSNDASISIRFPPQVVQKACKLNWPFKAKFIISFICPTEPGGIWKYNQYISKIIEIRYKDCSKMEYICQIVEIPINKILFIRDGGIDLQILIILQ